MGGIFFAAHRGKIEANPTLIDTLERGIEKGDRFVEQSPFWGCFYEAKTRKFIACEVRKPLILLHFSKNPISPLAPMKQAPLPGNAIKLRNSMVGRLALKPPKNQHSNYVRRAEGSPPYQRKSYLNDIALPGCLFYL